jgi:PAS domain S-box-containing protein
MLGYAAEELHKLTYMDLTPEKWHDLEATIIKTQLLPNGHSEIYEKEYIRKDGTVFPVELRTVLMRNQAGNPSGMWAIVRDISQRKVIEQNLRESEERYRNLLEKSLQGVIVFQDMRIAYINTAVTELLGYSLADLGTLTLADIGRLMHPDDQRVFQQRLEQRLDGVPLGERYSIRVFHKNGDIHWLETRTTPIQIQGKPAVIITFIDVTDIREAQAKLEESAKVQQTILNASEALVFLVDTNGVLIASNDKFARRMGLKADAVSGTTVYDILPEDVLRARKVPFDQVISSGKSISFVDSREGTWFENSYYPISDESGKVVNVAVYARDITKQRQLTEALQASEEKYRILAEGARDVIFTLDREGYLTYVNSFGANYFGLESHQMMGRPLSQFFPDSITKKGTIIQVFGTGEAASVETEINFPAQKVWFNSHLIPMRNSSGEIISILGISRDISKRKKAEDALAQARDQLEERVEERTKELSASQEQLRQLTAQTVRAQEEERREISRELHDEAGQALVTLKFDLAAIQNELPKSEVRSRKRLSGSMEKIDQTMLHIRGISHRLRPPVLEIGGIHLSLQDYCREISERTRIPISYEGVDMPGLSDEIGISLFRFVQEALTNIMKHSQASQVTVRLQYKKGQIHLSVEDNGRGMDETVRTEGQGLLGIKERLKILGGDLEVHSRKGRGVKLVGRVPWIRPPMV